ncbi:Ycf48-like protein [Cesiribacter andamanensis AMV16]|uniref:Ycf48-like protein n=1 Tax=Cesiribacter andamanensis AMV16 TaxID=1279009 RepID=M7N4I3_9BACT|nr:Ycf48-like protein [Cesiribacter andamanensis]EMR02207.1 Ycf48-like protein [Cesiribacter andamanensis AMV16]
MGGKILLLQSRDGGRSWQPLEAPAPEEGEAFFAASNASIAMCGTQQAWIGTGGGAIRVLHTPDAGRSWQLQYPPMLRISEAAGIYALHFASAKKGVAVGGAYDKPELGRLAALYTTNGGRRWRLSEEPPRGYRCGLALLPGTATYISVGTTGTDLSRDGGKRWQPLNTENLNSIRFAPAGRRGWAVGAKGAIFLLEY